MFSKPTLVLSSPPPSRMWPKLSLRPGITHLTWLLEPLWLQPAPAVIGLLSEKK